MNSIILGIDISKATFDVALLVDNKITTKKTTKGFFDLKQWLKNNKTDIVHACMEATGSYGIKLAQYLYENNFKVSVVNPARIKGFAMSKLSRVKTDKADSELIARFCQVMQPDLWQPAPKHIQELQQWVKRLDNLIANKNQENNRLKEAETKLVKHIQRHINFLDEEIKGVEKLIFDHIKNHNDLEDKSKLLASIPRVGEKTIAVVLTFLANVEDFDYAKQVAAFVGLNPKIRQSSSSVRGTGKISKTGDSELRKAFYMPAVVSIKFNPIIRDFAEHLSNAGKSKMVIVIASMRKLLHIIYGVLKNKTFFNEYLI